MKRVLLICSFILFAVLSTLAQWMYDDLSEAKQQLGVATLGSKVYFAGGSNESNSVSTVEVYDIQTESWDTIIDLSVSRIFISGVSSSNLVFFAGGFDDNTGAVYSEVDIWDPTLKMWTCDQLSEPRFFIGAAAKDNIVLFAGGINTMTGTTSDVVDIYDTQTGTWLPVAHLSAPRSAPACAVVGDLAIFAGGFDLISSDVSDVVDIYHFTSNTWTTSTLSQARAFAAATTVGNKVLIAGGVYDINQQSDVVDIYDALTGIWDTSNLSFPRAFMQWNAATVCGKAYFAGGGEMNLSLGGWTSEYDIIDIYNGDVDQWTIENLENGRINHAVAGLDNYLLVAGGVTGSPWELTSSMEIFVDDPTDCFVGVKPVQKKESHISIYPNPSSGLIHLETNEEYSSGETSVILYNLQGQRVHEQTLPAGDQEIDLQLPNGVYVLKIRAGEMVQQELICCITFYHFDGLSGKN